MRVGVISDIHANAPALRAVLRALRDEGVDEIVCLGDVVGYNAEPNLCLAMLEREGVPSILGNHELMVLGQSPCPSASVRRSCDWTRWALGPDRLQAIADWPDTRTCIGGGALAVHGAPEDTHRYLSTADRVQEAAAALGPGHPLVLFGHTHTAALWRVAPGETPRLLGSAAELDDATALWINPGTVGEPRPGSPGGCFAVVDTARGIAELRTVAVDWREVWRKRRAASLPPTAVSLRARVQRAMVGARRVGRLLVLGR